MKIAYILSTCAKSGPFIVARDIIDHLPSDVLPVDIFYLKEHENKMSFKGNLHKVSLHTRTDLSKYDVVHSHGFLGDVYAFLNRGSMKGRWVSTLHQKIAPDYSMAYNRVVGRMLEIVWVYMVGKAASVACITREMADYYKAISGSPKFVGIHNGVTPVVNDNVSPEEKMKLREMKSKYTVMGISANLIYRKGIDAVVRAMALPGADDLALIVLGDGGEKQPLLELAQSLGVDNRCAFLGYRENAIAYFELFDVYMMSSRSEGFGLCVIEAASQRIPVVCNDLTVYHELFDDEVVRFRLDDLPTMIAAVRSAVGDRARLSESIHKKYTSSYTAEKMSQTYLELYRSVAGK